MLPQKPNQVHKKPKETENKCKIIIKKRKDGTIIKSIEGLCTKEQLRALSQQENIDLEE